MDLQLSLINDGGKIITLSSGLTRVVMANHPAYGTIKAAVKVLTRYMAKELGPRGIAVNLVAPGAIATDFSGGVVHDKNGESPFKTAIAGLTILRSNHEKRPFSCNMAYAVLGITPPFFEP